MGDLPAYQDHRQAKGKYTLPGDTLVLIALISYCQCGNGPPNEGNQMIIVVAALLIGKLAAVVYFLAAHSAGDDVPVTAGEPCQCGQGFVPPF
jgi:hypothetical protein